MWKSFLALSLLIASAYSASCVDLTTCGDCLAETNLGFATCHWCDIDRKCHALGSGDSACSDIGEKCCSDSSSSSCNMGTCSAVSDTTCEYCSTGDCSDSSNNDWDPSNCADGFCCCGKDSRPEGKMCLTEFGCSADIADCVASECPTGCCKDDKTCGSAEDCAKCDPTLWQCDNGCCKDDNTCGSAEDCSTTCVPTKCESGCCQTEQQCGSKEFCVSQCDSPWQQDTKCPNGCCNMWGGDESPCGSQEFCSKTKCEQANYDNCMTPDYYKGKGEKCVWADDTNGCKKANSGDFNKADCYDFKTPYPFTNYCDNIPYSYSLEKILESPDVDPKYFSNVNDTKVICAALGGKVGADDLCYFCRFGFFVTDDFQYCKYPFRIQSPSLFNDDTDCYVRYEKEVNVQGFSGPMSCDQGSMNPRGDWDPKDASTWKYPGIKKLGVCFYCVNSTIIEDGDLLYCKPDGPADRKECYIYDQLSMTTANAIAEFLLFILIGVGSLVGLCVCGCLYCCFCKKDKVIVVRQPRGMNMSMSQMDTERRM